MGTRTGQYILDGAWTIAQDAGAPEYGFMIGANPGVRWSEEEGLRWLNDTQVEIVGLLPRANAVRVACELVEGSRQTAADLGLTSLINFVDIVCNIDADGVRGAAITKRERSWFDSQRPGWHADTGSEVLHWIANDEDPKAIYIWPAVTEAGEDRQIEVIHSAVPADLAQLTDTISLDDIYATALMFGVLARFYMKDATFGKNPAIAAAFAEAMRASLGLRAANASALDAKATQKA